MATFTFNLTFAGEHHERQPNLAATGPTIAPARATSKRRRGLMALGLVAMFGGVLYGGYWFLFARHYESTDDSYVNGDLVQITSEVPAT